MQTAIEDDLPWAEEAPLSPSPAPQEASRTLKIMDLSHGDRAGVLPREKRTDCRSKPRVVAEFMMRLYQPGREAVWAGLGGVSPRRNVLLDPFAT